MGFLDSYATAKAVYGDGGEKYMQDWEKGAIVDGPGCSGLLGRKPVEVHGRPHVMVPRPPAAPSHPQSPSSSRFQRPSLGCRSHRESDVQQFFELPLEDLEYPSSSSHDDDDEEEDDLDHKVQKQAVFDELLISSERGKHLQPKQLSQLNNPVRSASCHQLTFSGLGARQTPIHGHSTLSTRSRPSHTRLASAGSAANLCVPSDPGSGVCQRSLSFTRTHDPIYKNGANANDMLSRIRGKYSSMTPNKVTGPLDERSEHVTGLADSSGGSHATDGGGSGGNSRTPSRAASFIHMFRLPRDAIMCDDTEYRNAALNCHSFTCGSAAGEMGGRLRSASSKGDGATGVPALPGRINHMRCASGSGSGSTLVQPRSASSGNLALNPAAQALVAQYANSGVGASSTSRRLALAAKGPLAKQ